MTPSRPASAAHRVTLYGATYSVYVRIVRLVLEEIGVPYDLVEIDIFDKAGVPAEYTGRHPFGRIPALQHDGFRLFETDAIVHYLLDAFGDHDLVPVMMHARARMRQIMRIMDNYAYRALVWDIYVAETERGRAGDLGAEELSRGRKCLAVLDDLAGPMFLAGEQMTVADLWAVPMLVYLRLAPAGRTLLEQFPRLTTWLERMLARPAVVATRFPAELKLL